MPAATVEVHPCDPGGLTEADVERFVVDGAVVVRGAVPRAVAEACRDEVLADLGIDPDDRRTWSRPCARVLAKGGGVFAEAATAAPLVAATDAVVGAGRWVVEPVMGTFPVRVPHPDPPDDDGWHVDVSIPPADDPDTLDFSRWGVSARSDGRALLWLVLLSEVGPDDAPTRVRVGSHAVMARDLALTGEATVTPQPLPPLDHLPVALATGGPGDVFLLHPFTVHAAQRHRGRRPRVIGQPARRWADRPDPGRPAAERGPVEEAIARAVSTL